MSTGRWGESGPAGGLVGGSGAHLSIASSWEDQATLEAGFGGAVPLGAVTRPDEEWRLPERELVRRVGCG